MILPSYRSGPGRNQSEATDRFAQEHSGSAPGVPGQKTGAAASGIPGPAARDALFDNLKAFMLFLVVIGHILDPYIERQDSLYRWLMQYIYLFHMPMFAFITGYFSKNTAKARKTAVRKALLPYLFWQLLYMATALVFIRLGLASYNTDVFRPSLLLPSSPLYYLLCVFVWKLLAPDLAALRHPVILSVAAGALVSLVFDPDFHIGWGACLSLLPFFTAGLLCSQETIRRIRALPRAASVLILTAAILPATALPYSFRNVRFTYESVGLTPAVGIGYRLLFYAVAFLLIAAFLNLFSARRHFFTRVGTNAILVYAGSSFAAPSLYLLAVSLLPFSLSVPANLAAMSLFAAVLVLFCSMDWMKRLYERILQIIASALFKEEAEKEKAG